MFVIFFVKKKTAYEMRISDWSSAVCSSDLRGFRLFSDTPFPWREGRVLDTFEVEALAAIAAVPASAFVRFDERDGATDRKSVVKGKSVSGRVDFSGSRIIKKTRIHKSENATCGEIVAKNEKNYGVEN